MKKLLPLFLVSWLLLLAGCKKETETDAQLIARRIQDVIRTESVIRLIPTTEYVPGSGGGTVVYDPAYGKKNFILLSVADFGELTQNLPVQCALCTYRQLRL